MKLPLFCVVTARFVGAEPEITTKFGFVERSVAIPLDLACVLLVVFALPFLNHTLGPLIVAIITLLAVGAVAWDVARYRSSEKVAQEIGALARHAA